MKKNKKLLSVMIGVVLWLSVLLISGAVAAYRRSVSAKADNGNAPAADDKLKIVTTIYPPCDFAQKVGGEHVEVTMLLKPGMESHSYEPTPADIIKIMNSDVFLYAGGESDVWVEELLSAGESRTQAYALLDWVDPIEEESVEGMQTKGHSHDHEAHSDAHEAHEQVEAVHLHEEEYDEHVWTSPQNAMLIVEHLRALFCSLDPEHGDQYTVNAEKYQTELKKLDTAFWKVVDSAERKTLVFGDRFPLLYFVRSYGLDYYAAFPGCSMETEPSAATIAFLTDKVKEENIPVIFYLELSNGKVAEAIAECTGAKTACFYSGHAITADDLEAGEDYLSLMYRNLDTLQEALGKK